MDLSGAFGQPDPHYVIEQMKGTDGGATIYGAFFRAPFGHWLPWQARFLYSAVTVTGVKEFVLRHYPWAQLAYEPDDNAAAIRQAIEAMGGTP